MFQQCNVLLTQQHNGLNICSATGGLGGTQQVTWSLSFSGKPKRQILNTIVISHSGQLISQEDKTIHYLVISQLNPIWGHLGTHTGYRDKHTHTETVSLINLTACVWTVGRNRSTWKEPAPTRSEHANSTLLDCLTQELSHHTMRLLH